jgi:hypothetical protein
MLVLHRAHRRVPLICTGRRVNEHEHDLSYAICDETQTQTQTQTQIQRGGWRVAGCGLRVAA